MRRAAILPRGAFFMANARLQTLIIRRRLSLVARAFLSPPASALRDLFLAAGAKKFRCAGIKRRRVAIIAA